MSRGLDLQTVLSPGLSALWRARLFRWLIAQAREQNDLSDASIWWFLIECDEDPARELIGIYKISPSWQRFFPDALTPVGWDRFAGWLKFRHCIDASGVDYQVFRPRVCRGVPSGLRMPRPVETAVSASS